MKYLRYYNLFENKYSSANLPQKELVANIEDILLELKDVGFNILISRKYIRISNTHKTFKYDEVEEYIERLKDYLGKKFIKIDIQFQNVSKTDLMIKSLFYKAKIFYKCDNIINIKIQYSDMPEHIEKWVDDFLKGK